MPTAETRPGAPDDPIARSGLRRYSRMRNFFGSICHVIAAIFGFFLDLVYSYGGTVPKVIRGANVSRGTQSNRLLLSTLVFIHCSVSGFFMAANWAQVFEPQYGPNTFWVIWSGWFVVSSAIDNGIVRVCDGLATRYSIKQFSLIAGLIVMNLGFSVLNGLALSYVAWGPDMAKYNHENDQAARDAVTRTLDAARTKRDEQASALRGTAQQARDAVLEKSAQSLKPFRDAADALREAYQNVANIASREVLGPLAKSAPTKPLSREDTLSGKVRSDVTGNAGLGIVATARNREVSVAEEAWKKAEELYTTKTAEFQATQQQQVGQIEKNLTAELDALNDVFVAAQDVHDARMLQLASVDHLGFGEKLRTLNAVSEDSALKWVFITVLMVFENLVLIFKLGFPGAEYVEILQEQVRLNNVPILHARTKAEAERIETLARAEAEATRTRDETRKRTLEAWDDFKPRFDQLQTDLALVVATMRSNPHLTDNDIRLAEERFARSMRDLVTGGAAS